MVNMRNLFAVTAGLLSISPGVSSNCFNDVNFTYRYAGQYRSCQNIRIDEFRRQEMCSRFEDVMEYCPQTCGRCCVDMPDYRFRTKRNSPIEVACSFVANNPERQNKYCRKWSAGMMIRDACPLSCDFCQPAVLQKPPSPPPVVVTPPPTKAPTKAPTRSPTAAPTKSPTAAPTKLPTPIPTKRPTNPPRTGNPTPSPTPAPTRNPTKAPTKPPTHSPTAATSSPTFICEDNLNYFANNNQSLTCLKIGESENLRQKWCSEPLVVRNCPQTCGVCCRDDADWLFTTYRGVKKRCRWVKKERIRKERYCNKKRDGKIFKLKCPVTCGFCFDPVL